MNNNRLVYIDAMRGLAMLLVVMGHVLLFTFHHSQNPFYKVLNECIQVPLFFMVSGMCFRLPKVWSSKEVAKFVYGKALLLCVPAFLWMAFYGWVFQYSLMDAVTDTWKYGYWFTFSLFAFMLLYIFFDGLMRIFNLAEKHKLMLMMLCSIAVAYLGTLAMKLEDSYMPLRVLGVSHFQQFPYFVLGVLLASKAFNCINSSRSIVYEMGGVISILMIIYTYSTGKIEYLGSLTLWLIVMRVCCLLWIKKFFSTLESSSVWLIKALSYIGRYTLDIYFIHYFFLPRNLEIVGAFFKESPNAIVEWLLAFALALPIIVFSLLLGRMVRVHNMLGRWLLGAKE